MNTAPPIIGIVGGYGPATSAVFCTALVRHAQRMNPRKAPSYAMDNVAISLHDAELCINGDMAATERLVEGVSASIGRLAAMGATVAAVPCNSVHVLHDRFQGATDVEVIHIADATVARLKRKGVAKVGMLASGMTLKHRVYDDRLEAAGITRVLPDPLTQSLLNGAIMSFVATGEVKPGDRLLLSQLMQQMAGKGVPSILLACTDLACMLERGGVDCPLPVEDSMDALAEECAKRSLAAP